MFAMPRRRVSLVALLLLIIVGCARAIENAEHDDEMGFELCDHRISDCTNGAVPRQIVVTDLDTSVSPDSIAPATTQDKVDDGRAEEPTIPPPPPQVDTAEELQLRRRKTPTSAESAQITAPPLLPRQDQSQIDQLNARIQSLQQSAQQALQALSDASRSVSQASQQLSQDSQQLSQSSSRLSESSQSLSLALSLATQSEASLTGALSAALSSGSSAFASCTSSASSVLALVSGDAVTKVGAALAQATNARTEADREVNRAQSSAVSITQAAAIIVGASAGSSLITIVIILLVLRYRRKKRREREAQAQAEDERRGGGMQNTLRPGTSFSVNSMVGATPRDIKDSSTVYLPPPPPPAEMTGSTTVATATTAVPERFQNARVVDVSRNGSKNSTTSGAGAGAPSKSESSSSFLGQRLSKLGITRRPTGEALTTDAVQHAGRGRRPVAGATTTILADPPAGRRGRERERQQQEEEERARAGGKAITPTWSVFPTVDSDPQAGMRRLWSRTGHDEVEAAAAGVQDRQDQQRQPRPLSSGAALQAWLQTATASPFGPLEPSPPPPQTQPRTQPQSPAQRPYAATAATDTVQAPKLARRLSEVQWPLQESSSSGSGGAAADGTTGLTRSGTDASSRYSQRTVTTVVAAPGIGEERGGDGDGEGGSNSNSSGDDTHPPVVMMRNSPAVVSSPRIVTAAVASGRRRGPGLPGSVRKMVSAGAGAGAGNASTFGGREPAAANGRMR